MDGRTGKKTRSFKKKMQGVWSRVRCVINIKMRVGIQESR
jgi:hypothetical protein